MQRERELDVTKWMLEAASQVLGVSRRRPLRLTPISDFKIRNDRRPRPFSNCNRVADMITMTVRDQNKIRRDFVGRDGGGGVAAEEGVNQHLMSAKFQTHCAVTIPSEFIHLPYPPSPKFDSPVKVSSLLCGDDVPDNRDDRLRSRGSSPSNRAS